MGVMDIDSNNHLATMLGIFNYFVIDVVVNATVR